MKRWSPALAVPLTPRVTLKEVPSHSGLTFPIWEMSKLGVMISPIPYDFYSFCLDFGGPA